MMRKKGGFLETLSRLESSSFISQIFHKSYSKKLIRNELFQVAHVALQLEISIHKLFQRIDLAFCNT